MLLHAWQRNFAGHPDKCPAEALPRNKALGGISGTLGSFRRCYGNTSEESSAFRAAPPNGERPSPHQETEVYLSSEHRTPALLYLRRTSLREILPPDALRHIGAMTESSRRQTAEGGEVILCPAVSANPLRLSNERPSEAYSRSLLKLVVMNCIFNVNKFFPDSRKKIFFERDLSLFIKKTITYNCSGTGSNGMSIQSFRYAPAPCFRLYFFTR